MTVTHNEKKNTDANEKPSSVCYRSLIVVGFSSLLKK